MNAPSMDRHEAAFAEMRKQMNLHKAQSALRGRILQEIRDKIGPLVAGLEDEGDRIYLGSTNDKDWLTEIEETIFEVHDEVWATLNREETDPYADLYELRVVTIPALIDRAEKAEAELEATRKALEPFAAVDPMDVYETEDEDANGVYVLSQADFHRARAALSEAQS